MTTYNENCNRKIKKYININDNGNKNYYYKEYIVKNDGEKIIKEDGDKNLDLEDYKLQIMRPKISYNDIDNRFLFNFPEMNFDNSFRKNKMEKENISKNMIEFKNIDDKNKNVDDMNKNISKSININDVDKNIDDMNKKDIKEITIKQNSDSHVKNTNDVNKKDDKKVTIKKRIHH